MNKIEWKEKSKEYKIGYIIGCIIMFFLGLLNSLSIVITTLRIPSLIFSCLLIIYLIRIKVKRYEKKKL